MRLESDQTRVVEDAERTSEPGAPPVGPLLAVWGGIALIALIVRALLLDRAALSPSEATYAFAAWQASQGQLDGSIVEFGAPLLSYLMTGLFFLLGASDVAARLVSVAAGTALAVTPVLLTTTLGLRTTIAAGVLIALSPIAVQAARVADPASLAALLVALIVAGTVRLLTDRPAWSPWLVAIAGGLAVVCAPSVLIGLLTALAAAASTWNVRRTDLRAWFNALRAPQARVYLITGALVALVAGTGGFMDLRGAGFPLGDLWGGAAGILTPTPFPSRNLGALLAYWGPVLLAATIAFVRGARAGEQMVLFLGEWSLLLFVIALAFGQSVLALVLLPVLPTALLAGRLLEGLPLDRSAYRLSGGTWAVMALIVALGGVGLLTVSRTVGDTKGAPPLAVAAGVLALALIAYLWRQEIPAGERLPALALLLGGLYAAFVLGTIGRLSYGGSGPGTEIMLRQETAPELRAAFDDLNTKARADSSRVLVYGPTTPVEVRWYGRYIAQTSSDRSAPPNAFRVLEAPAVPQGSTPADAERTPWTTISQLNRNDFNLLSVLRWVVSRKGFVTGQERDIIVAQ